MELMGNNTMKNKLVYALLATLAISYAHAETTEESSLFNGFSTSGSVAFLTDYYSRGYSQTEGDPAVQGFLRVDHDSGLYAQLFASNSELDIGSSIELDYYLVILIIQAQTSFYPILIMKNILLLQRERVC